MVMKNKILEKRASITEAIATLKYQIKHLRIHYSKEQVRCWRIRRYNLERQLESLPTEEQLQRGAKRVNYSNSTKYWK